MSKHVTLCICSMLFNTAASERPSRPQLCKSKTCSKGCRGRELLAKTSETRDLA